MFRFTLTYSGTETTVIEPKGWDTFKSELKRDFKSHGVIFKYTSGTLKLGFADGRDILETAFQNDGFDAVVTLTVDQRNTDLDTWVNVFTGNAVMKNRELTEDYFSVDFESSTFQQKIANRLKTPVNLETTLDLDGNTLSGTIDKQTDTFGTIRLNRSYDALLFEDNVPPSTFISSDNRTDTDSLITTKNQKAFFGYGVKRLNTLDDINLTSTSISVVNGDYLEDDGPIPIWTAAIGGQTTITGQISYIINIRMYHSTTADIQYAYALKLIQYREGAVESTQTIDSDNANDIAAAAPSTAESFVAGVNPIESAISKTFSDVQSGDQFYLSFELQGQASAGDNSLESTVELYEWDDDSSPDSFITITQLQDQRDVTLSHWLVHDVFKRISYIISGTDDLFYSDFFGLTDHGYAEDGCGGLNTITNGYQIRGISRQLNMSLDDMLSWAQARYGVGWGFDKQVDGTYKIRVELMEHFYSDSEILDLGSPLSIKENDSYRETSMTELQINSVRVGYSDFFDQIGINGQLEDFLTVSNYSLPLSSIEGNYTKISPLIASNDIIQATYDQRNLFTSWKYDEDNFIIAVVRTDTGFTQENNENFDIVTGLDDSSTAYNIRHAPVYMMLEHALIINSSLFGKDITEVIQNTVSKINISFSAQYGTYESCLLGDSQRLLRTSTGNIEIGDNFVGQRLFKPVQHELTVAMTATQLNTVIDAMENNSTDPTKDLGYLTYRNNEGEIQTGYPMTIAWNPNDEIAQITTLEKADNYGV